MTAWRWGAPINSSSMKAGLDLALIVFLVQLCDSGHWWPAAAMFDHRVDLGTGSGEHRLDRAILPVAHPAIQAQTPGHLDRPAPIPHALNPPFNADTNSFSTFGHQFAPADPGSRSLTCCKLGV